ncbi:DUF5990 family protein [Mangrovihabitans endophyticus]|uniref:Monooxygenase n=1 Tax=Mangrovihabitans endophyticus TaxID=1751298 RepID=A0A8J3FPC1_9ACTN|nr:DUF5990 family protein [Mangrovihabitans endophyticus]GGK91653.1 hypothetical protein GCM10012284_26930 [Mangrovihabitans endophyticus]
MRIRIEGHDLPGRRAGAQADSLRLGGVQVGVQRAAEVVSRLPCDASEACWEFAVTSREVDGLLDVGGPFVHGRPGARFLYLAWGAAQDTAPDDPPGAGFALFRRAKLLFTDVPAAQLRAAHEDRGALVARLGLTGADGGPVCARVRPPQVTWSLR